MCSCQHFGPLGKLSVLADAFVISSCSKCCQVPDEGGWVVNYLSGCIPRFNSLKSWSEASVPVKLGIESELTSSNTSPDRANVAAATAIRKTAS